MGQVEARAHHGELGTQTGPQRPGAGQCLQRAERGAQVSPGPQVPRAHRGAQAIGVKMPALGGTEVDRHLGGEPAAEGRSRHRPAQRLTSRVRSVGDERRQCPAQFVLACADAECPSAAAAPGLRQPTCPLQGQEHRVLDQLPGGGGAQQREVAQDLEVSHRPPASGGTRSGRSWPRRRRGPPASAVRPSRPDGCGRQPGRSTGRPGPASPAGR